MTPTSRLQRIVAPLAAALATAVLISGALWVQRSRGAWPFPATEAPPAAASTIDHSAHAAPAATGQTVPDRVPVDATPAAVQHIGVRLEVVKRESLTSSVRAVATVVPDESRISHVHARVAGWVDKLDVAITGEAVTAGQPVARIFSWELLASQTEYLAARRATSTSGIASVVLASGRTRLGILGMTPAEIDAIEASGEPMRAVTVVAPASGIVVARGVTAGTSVDPSTTLITIADLSRVWILAEVPEADILSVGAGTRAELDFPASGRSPFASRIEFVYPTLSERTRTLRVRLSAANPGGGLKPGLYGTATFRSAGRQVITVPRDAVVDTGLEQHVFVATGDRFEPRAVALGTQLADRVEVLTGLSEGERIVAAGVFLLDSESRLRATGGTGGHDHGTAPAPQPEAPPSPATDPHAGHRS